MYFPDLPGFCTFVRAPLPYLPLMPLLFIRHPRPAVTFGVWQIAEPEEFFRENTPLSAAETAEWSPLKGPRRLEWLAGRWLLHHLSGHEVRLPLAKDVFSKPFFPPEAGLSCSLSHSHGLVGALLAPPSPAGGSGCDVQVLVEKMPRLAAKFLRPEETDFIGRHTPSEQFVLQHVFWTAKESLYKAWGLKALDFRANLRVEPFRWKENRAETTGWVEKDGERQAYRLLCESVEAGEAWPAFVWTLALPA